MNLVLLSKMVRKSKKRRMMTTGTVRMMRITKTMNNLKLVHGVSAILSTPILIFC